MLDVHIFQSEFLINITLFKLFSISIMSNKGNKKSSGKNFSFTLKGSMYT